MRGLCPFRRKNHFPPKTGGATILATESKIRRGVVRYLGEQFKIPKQLPGGEPFGDWRYSITHGSFSEQCNEYKLAIRVIAAAMFVQCT